VHLDIIRTPLLPDKHLGQDLQRSCSALPRGNRACSETAALSLYNVFLAAVSTFALKATRSLMDHTLVLVGGGHAHVQLVASTAQYPPRARRVLISDRPVSVYSGMLPAVVAGLLDASEADVHLPALAAHYGWEFIAASVVSVCAAERTLTAIRLGEDTPFTFRYSILSLDVGSATRPLRALEVPGGNAGGDGACDNSTRAAIVSTRPIGDLVTQLRVFEMSCRERTDVVRVVVVGCGKTGVELALALDARLRRNLPHLASLSVTIVGDVGALGKLLGPADTAIEAELRNKRIRLYSARHAVDVRGTAVLFDDGDSLPADLVVLATGAGAHAWMKNSTDLEVDGDGFVLCTPELRSTRFPFVFAAGDCAGFGDAFGGNFPPKAGVYAVRSGPTLERNILAVLGMPVGAEEKASLAAFSPQTTALSLISLGNREHAIGTKGNRLVISGHWVYNFKIFLDRRWQTRFQLGPNAGDGWDGFTGSSSFDYTPAESAAALFGAECSGDFSKQYAVLRRMDREPDFARQVHECARRSELPTV
jgi:NADH dehydrogenase FAD-containing subunit